MKFDKCDRESLRFSANKGHRRLDIHPIRPAGTHEILLSYQFMNKYQVLQFWFIFIDVFKNSFLMRLMMGLK